MNEDKIVEKILKAIKDIFLTKSEMNERFASMENNLITTLENKLMIKMEERFPTKGEMNKRFDENEERWDKQDETNQEILASVKVLDKVLEQNPVPRIERVESHLGLPRFVLAGTEE